jgi:mannosidase alpha-like ER degradation enhancer 1
LNDVSGFDHAVQQVIKHVSFNVDTKPQVFESTIRALGGLLSAHLFASDEEIGRKFAVDGEKFKLPWYRGELLGLALDLGNRLLPAFDTPTGIPYARVCNSAVLRGK